MITNITFENMHYGGYAKLSMLDKFEWVQFALRAIKFQQVDFFEKNVSNTTFKLELLYTKLNLKKNHCHLPQKSLYTPLSVSMQYSASPQTLRVLDLR